MAQALAHVQGTKIGTTGITEDTQHMFLAAKQDKLKKEQCWSAMIDPEEKDGPSYAWKKEAKKALMYKPFSIFTKADKSDEMCESQREMAEEKARHVLLEPETVLLPGSAKSKSKAVLVVLSEQQKAEVRAAKTARAAYDVLAGLSYKRGDTRTLLTFKARFNKAVENVSLCKKDVEAWLAQIYNGHEMVAAVDSLGDKWQSENVLVGTVVYHLPDEPYASVKNRFQNLIDLSTKEIPLTWAKMREDLMNAERTRRATEEKSEDESDEDETPSAQVGFQQRQRQYHQDGNGGRWNQRGRGGGRGGGRDGRDGGGRGGQNDTKVRCFCCGSTEHKVYKCPDNFYNKQERGGQDS